MNNSKLVSAVAEAFMIYGLIIVGYGILAIHVTKTWFGDWHVDRYLPQGEVILWTVGLWCCSLSHLLFYF
jgi:hypothetical protein